MVPKSWLYVKKSNLPRAGKGLFTKKLIPKGTNIVEYKGTITTWEDARHENGRNRYLFYLNKNHVIDAKNYKKGLARYANDARGSRKRDGLFNNSIYFEENNKIYIKSFRDIRAGGEILVGYGKEYWDVIKNI